MMQVDQTRPGAIAKLLSTFAEQQSANQNQLLGVLRDKIKKEQINSIATGYLKSAQDKSASIQDRLNAGINSAFQLLPFGKDAEPAIQLIGETNKGLMAAMKPDQNVTPFDVIRSMYPTDPQKQLDTYQQMNGSNLVPVVQNGQLAYVPKTAVPTGAEALSTVNAKTGADASMERTKTVINATDKRQERGIEQQNKLDQEKASRAAEQADKNLIGTHLKAIDELKKNKSQWEEKLVKAETEEGKKMAQKRIEEIDSQLAERNTNIDDIRRKYPHWKQPGAPAAAPAQSASKPLNTRADGKVKVKLSDGRIGFLAPSEFNPQTMTYEK